MKCSLYAPWLRVGGGGALEQTALRCRCRRPPQVDLGAPGSSIASTYFSGDNVYAYMSGTSMAT